MADREFKIKITTSNDPSGAQQPEQGLRGVSRATTEATGEAFKFETKGRELHVLFGKLNEIAPELGYALKAALSPESAGLIGAVVVVELLVKLFEKMRKDAEEFKTTMATEPDLSGIKNSVASIAGAMSEADEKAQDFLATIEEIIAAQKTLAESSDADIAKLEQELKTLQLIAKAKKEQMGAELELAKMKGQITPEQYDIAKIKLEAQSEREAAKTEVAYLNKEKEKREKDRATAKTSVEDLLKQEKSAQERVAIAENNVEQAKQHHTHAKEETEKVTEMIVGNGKEPGLQQKVEEQKRTLPGSLQGMSDDELREQLKHPLTVPGAGIGLQEIKQYLELADKLRDARTQQAGFAGKMRQSEGDMETAGIEKNSAGEALKTLQTHIRQNADSVKTLTTKIDDLARKLDEHKDDGRVFDAQDRARRAQGLPQLEKDLGVTTDQGAGNFTQQYLGSIDNINKGRGTQGDEQARQAMVALLQSSKESDGRLYMLIRDLISHQGNLSQALQQLQQQIGTTPNMRGSPTGQ